MDKDKILLEGTEAEELKKFLSEDPDYVLMYLVEYATLPEELEADKGLQYGLLEAYREKAIAAEALQAAGAEGRSSESGIEKEEIVEETGYNWEQEVDRALKLGWLKKKDRAAALELIQTDRAAYDKLLTIATEKKK